MITALPRIAIAVHDFDAAVAVFADAFGMPVADFSERTVPGLGAHVGMCMPDGGSNIELMAPANPDLPLSQSLQKFLDTRGEGLYALMLEAPDPDAEADLLAGRGLDVLPLMTGAGGRDIHPRSTHGVLIRIYPDGSVPHQDGLEGSDPGWSGITRVIIATTDANQAARTYGTGLGLDVDTPVIDEARGVLSVVVTPPKGGCVELVSATDTRRPFGHEIAQFVGSGHEGMYALVLQADEPEAAAARLGTAVTASTQPALGASVFGTRLLFEPSEQLV